MDAPDVVLVGAGINGLVCALVLARGGLTVQVIEDKPAVGGGCRTEHPFPRAPRLSASTGAHRVGLVPRDLARLVGVELPVARRDPSAFVPTREPGQFLLAGAGPDGARAAVEARSSADGRAIAAMHAELAELADDLAAAWLAPPLSVEDTAARYVRPSRREAMVALCRGSVAAYLDRFGIADELTRAWIAADALGGVFGGPSSNGTGAALLVRFAARSAAAAGDAVAHGGVGALVRALSEAAQRAGVSVLTGRAVTQILVEGNTTAGVALAGGEVVRASTVVCNADPSRLRAMVGADLLPAEYSRKIDGFARGGSVTKVNLAMARLPVFRCLPEDRGQHAATMHLLAAERPEAALEAAFAAASSGRLPDAPPIECVIPTAADPSLRDPEGRHHVSLLVPWAPYALIGTTWAAEEDGWVRRIIGALDELAPGAASDVVDAFALHPKKLETHFGVTRGHIHHVDDAFVFADRMAYATPIGGLYACGAGCAPAGGVFGAAGYNAAKRVLEDLELGLERTEIGRKPVVS